MLRATRFTTLCGLLLYCLAAAMSMSNAVAETYPTKPVRLIVPFPPGAYTDTVARVVAAKMSEGLGQAVVIENRAGAGGNIGAAYVASADPDGYTLLMSTVANAISVTAYAKLPYDLAKDLIPISLVAKVPYVIAVHSSVQANSIAELINLSKAQPGKLHYSSSGNGTGPHLAAELFNARTGAGIVHVPYKGIAPAIAETVAGRVPISVPSLDSALGHIQGGRLRALAITSGKRSPLLPNVPTMAEAGVPEVEISAWGGIQAPAGTKREIADKLSVEIRKAVASPDVEKRLLQFGAEPVGTTPEEFGRFIRAEIDRWAPIVKRIGLKMD